jgi:hypothetical protein
MKKKFKLHITEVQKGFVEVEAENIDAAQEMYLDEYNEGNVTWTHSTISEVTAEEITGVTGKGSV